MDETALKKEFLELFRIHRCSCERVYRTMEGRGGLTKHQIERIKDRWLDQDPHFASEFYRIHEQIKDVMENYLIDLTDLAVLPDGVPKNDHKALMAAGVDHKLLNIGLKAVERWLMARHGAYRVNNKVQLGDRTTIYKPQIVLMSGDERKKLNEMAKDLLMAGKMAQSEEDENGGVAGAD